MSHRHNVAEDDDRMLKGGGGSSGAYDVATVSVEKGVLTRAFSSLEAA